MAVISYAGQDSRSLACARRLFITLSGGSRSGCPYHGKQADVGCSAPCSERRRRRRRRKRNADGERGELVRMPAHSESANKPPRRWRSTQTKSPSRWHWHSGAHDIRYGILQFEL
ncbi:hypothetical protein BDW22DRAFT_144361 [Trametopsis cervina]|nr:hypothetical protein BDW22DRAFT_144361 [Trametopsis cervina]